MSTRGGGPGHGRENRPATPDDVRTLCESLPEVRFGTSWGDRPTFLVPATGKGRGFVLYRAPRHDAVDPATGEEYDDLLVIQTADAGDKQALVDADSPFFTIDHFRNSKAVLVQESRLGEISVDELREVITDAWLAVAPKGLARRFREGEFARTHETTDEDVTARG